MAQTFYYTLKKGETKVLNVNAHPRSNYYVSSYRWALPNTYITQLSGGSFSDSSCKILAANSTKNIAGNRILVSCTWYQKEKNAIVETLGGNVWFYITINEEDTSTPSGTSNIKVLDSTPVDGEENVSTDAKITLKFNQAVSNVPSASIDQWCRLETEDGQKTYVNSQFTNSIYADGKSEGCAVFTPQQQLRPSTRYTFIMPSGCIKNQAGELNSNKFQFSFVTADEQSVTNINNIFNSYSNSPKIFNINGLQLKTLQKGINIIDGKKVIYK